MKNAKLGQKGRKGVTWPTYKIIGPSIFRKQRKLKTSNFLRMYWTNEKKYIIRSKRSQRGHLSYFRILGPLYITGTVEARNFKFGKPIEQRDTNGTNQKLGQRGPGSGHVT